MALRKKQHNFILEVIDSSDEATVQDNKAIEVSGIDDSITEDILKKYFENKRSGSKRGAVKTCSIVKEGTAHITFHDNQGMNIRFG